MPRETQVERAGLGDLERRVAQVGPIGEQLAHLGRRGSATPSAFRRVTFVSADGDEPPHTLREHVRLRTHRRGRGSAPGSSRRRRCPPARRDAACPDRRSSPARAGCSTPTKSRSRPKLPRKRGRVAEHRVDAARRRPLPPRVRPGPRATVKEPTGVRADLHRDRPRGRRASPSMWASVISRHRFA